MLVPLIVYNVVNLKLGKERGRGLHKEERIKIIYNFQAVLVMGGHLVQNRHVVEFNKATVKSHIQHSSLISKKCMVGCLL